MVIQVSILWRSTVQVALHCAEWEMPLLPHCQLMICGRVSSITILQTIIPRYIISDCWMPVGRLLRNINPQITRQPTAARLRTPNILHTTKAQCLECGYRSVSNVLGSIWPDSVLYHQADVLLQWLQSFLYPHINFFSWQILCEMREAASEADTLVDTWQKPELLKLDLFDNCRSKADLDCVRYCAVSTVEILI